MLSQIRNKVIEEATDTELDMTQVNSQLKKAEKDLVRGQVLNW